MWPLRVRDLSCEPKHLITIGNWRKKLGAYFAPLRKSSLQRLPYRNRSRPRQLAPLRRKRLFLNDSVSRSTSILCIRCCFRDRCARAAVSHLNWGRCARQHALPLSDPPKTKRHSRSVSIALLVRIAMVPSLSLQPSRICSSNSKRK